MANKTYIGIDNGVTGTIGVLSTNYHDFWKVPIFNGQDYTKKKQTITRIDTKRLIFDLTPWAERDSSIAILEKPFTGKFYKAVVSAARAFEATLIVLESLTIPYMVVGCNVWQQELFPGVKTSIELKKASRREGILLYPKLTEIIKKHGDADGLLLAEWAKRNNL